MTKSQVIPIFNAYYDFDETIKFYKDMGFELVYYQKSPYRFASVRNEIIEISLMGKKDFNIEQNAFGCYVVTKNIEEIHKKICSNLKENLGKIPRLHLPRISKINQTSEDYRFNITDPSGNSIIIGKPFSKKELKENQSNKLNELEQKYNFAKKLAYSKEDFTSSLSLVESLIEKSKKDKLLTLKLLILKADIHHELEEKNNIENIKPKIEKLIKSLNLNIDNQELQNVLNRWDEIKSTF